MDSEYTILFDAVRWMWYPRWLPFGTVHICVEKETTWQEAHHMASRVLEMGGWNVRVVKRGVSQPKKGNDV